VACCGVHARPGASSPRHASSICSMRVSLVAAASRQATGVCALKRVAQRSIRSTLARSGGWRCEPGREHAPVGLHWESTPVTNGGDAQRCSWRADSDLRCRNKDNRSNSAPSSGYWCGTMRVELVGSGFDLHVDGGAAGYTLLGVEAVGDNVDRLHRIGRGHIRDDMRQPRIADRRPIQPRIVVALRNTVDVAYESLLRVCLRRSLNRRAE